MTFIYSLFTYKLQINKEQQEKTKSHIDCKPVMLLKTKRKLTGLSDVSKYV